MILMHGKMITCRDGDKVRSFAEMRIDNWLADNNIKHIYGRRILINDDSRYRTDWFLPDFQLFIEYWGLTGISSYDKRRLLKMQLYEDNRLRLLNIFPDDNIAKTLYQKLKVEREPATSKKLVISVADTTLSADSKKHLNYDLILRLISFNLEEKYKDKILKWVRHKSKMQDTTSKTELNRVLKILPKWKQDLKGLGIHYNQLCV